MISNTLRSQYTAFATTLDGLSDSLSWLMTSYRSLAENVLPGGSRMMVSSACPCAVN